MFRKKSASIDDLNHHIQQLVEEKFNACKDNIVNQVENRLQEFTVKESQLTKEQIRVAVKDQEKFIANQVKTVYDTEFQTVKAKLDQECKDIVKVFSKNFVEYEEKLHKERMELLADRHRMKLELEAEYTKISMEWKKLRDERKMVEQVHIFQSNRIKLNVGGMVYTFTYHH